MKKFFCYRDEDGSLSWLSRFLIYSLSLAAGAAIAMDCYRDVISLVCLSGSKYAPTAIFLALFGLIFGIGRFIVKTDDAKKQFQDVFNQRNDQQLTTAIKLFTSDAGAFEQSTGLVLLISLRNKKGTEGETKKMIDNLTSSGIDIATLSKSGDFKRGATLSRANLQHAQLQSISLTSANLTYADLRNANLQGANLSESHIQQADLRDADLTRSNLKKADLANANLAKANLEGADLQGANLTNARITDVNFEGAHYSMDTMFSPGFVPEEHGMQFDADWVSM